MSIVTGEWVVQPDGSRTYVVGGKATTQVADAGAGGGYCPPPVAFTSAVASYRPPLRTPGPSNDMLAKAQTQIYDDAAMASTLPSAVFGRFKDALKTGAPTKEEDQKVIAEALFKWARKLGATSFAHWFFPNRGGGGAIGGMCGALKYDLFVDLVWKSDSVIKPFEEAFPHERLFVGETDGSSFPNGGLRVTHSAAAFTTWDRGSPCFVLDDTLYIPCAFVTYLGTCIDTKTPLLRSMDAVNRQCMRLLKAMKKETKATHCISYLGWEQEFFVVPANLYRARPDLVNCGRTLIGSLPTRHQQGELNYFAPVPLRVKELMDNIQAVMLKVGNPMTVKHNEVAPGQHEMCPIFCVANASVDSNTLFMQVSSEEAAKLGLMVLYHEKPFKGINGSGKHCNWSVGTDTGANFFTPGKTADSLEMYIAGVACLAYGLRKHNELVRCCVAHAGNDHRLGAQEAPPAIISLYPGPNFEAHVDAIIAGGPLQGLSTAKKMVDPCSRNTMAVPAGIEDRNRTAPFPHCGNRFEFRAVGSSQCCALPVATCNVIFASGCSYLSGLLESGMSLRDACARIFRENREVIFTGNGYSKEWPAEAAKRGLPNLNTTPLAARTFNTYQAKAVFKDMGIFENEEVDARAELMFEDYCTTLNCEAATLIKMVETGILPACAKDLSIYKDAPFLAGDRVETYSAIKNQNDKLKELISTHPSELEAEAFYLCETVKPQMEAVRALVDKAEGLMQAEFYPYPTYEALVYSHHS